MLKWLLAVARSTASFDVLTITRAGRLAILELKASEHIHLPCGLKTYPLTIAMCAAVGFVVTATFAQTPPSGTKPTESPVYKEKWRSVTERPPRASISADRRSSPKKLLVLLWRTCETSSPMGKGRMPKYAGKLKPEEIDNLVQQIRALNGK
jgi:hypothetical protein